MHVCRGACVCVCVCVCACVYVCIYVSDQHFVKPKQLSACVC